MKWHRFDSNRETFAKAFVQSVQSLHNEIERLRAVNREMRAWIKLLSKR